MKKVVIIASSIVIVMLLTLGLAVPGILLNLQGLGVGSSNLSGPVSSGTICVPYEYYVDIYFNSSFFGLIYLGSTTIPLNNITQVYPGNFSADLPSYTNVSVVVYYNSNTVSRGYRLLNSTLLAGSYTSVNITPGINSTVALGGEFDVVLLPPSYYTSSGKINVTVQEISLGTPTGTYTDLRVYLGNVTSGALLLVVYLDLRCYELSFYPPPLASAVLSLDQLISISKELGLWHHCCKHHHIRKCSDHQLMSLIATSPYYYQFPKAVEPLIQELTAQLKQLEEGNNSTQVLPGGLVVNLTLPNVNITVPNKDYHG
ncbi:hypothetical protein [Thermococcus sp.]